MNWFTLLLPYLPPLIAIFLTLISGLGDQYLANLIDNYDTKDKEIGNKKEFIKNVTLDGTARVGVFNSMFVSLISCISISSTQQYGIAFGTFLFLFAVFIVVFLWIIKFDAGELSSIQMRHLPFRKAAACQFILILVNLLLILEIFLLQRSA